MQEDDLEKKELKYTGKQKKSSADGASLSTTMATRAEL